MQHLLDEEVRQRARDVFLNLIVITEEAKIGLPPINVESTYWMQIWTDVLEEFVLRFGPYPSGFGDGFIRESAIPLPSDPRAEKAAAVVSRRAATQGSYVVKYGQLKYLRDTYERGRIRIAPASAYADPSLNPAVRDDELELDIQPPPPEWRLEVFHPETGARKGSITPRRGRITTRSRSNYYVYCLSSLLTPRLFLDFDADACLLVRRPQEFLNTVVTQLERRLPGFTGIAKALHYIDPLNTTLHEVDVFLCKHFRYAYQKEMRCLWLPPDVREELEPVFLELGSLSEVAELIPLSEA